LCDVFGANVFRRALLVRRRSDSQRLVIKQLPLHELNPGDQAGAHQEVQVLSMLSHPYIVGFHDSFVENDLLNIVIDYADGGDLHDLIKRAQRRPEPDNLLPEPFVLDVFAQIALAIEYIHERHILHRDLKTQNVFLTKDGHVMIGDFGISKILTADTDFARTVIGTPYCMLMFYRVSSVFHVIEFFVCFSDLSPELCEDKKYNHKSDIWALGCILYELATLRHAFDGNNLPALILKIIRGIYPPVDDRYSDDLKSLIASMLRENPDHRPELHEILELPFLQAIVQKHRAIIAAHVASRNGAGVKHKMALLEQRALDIAADQAVADMLPVSPTHRVAALVDSDHTDSEQTLSERAYFPAPPALLVEQPVGGPSGANRSLNSWMSEIENQIQNVQLDLRGGGVFDLSEI
jgi:serine/threonine protein kinase